MVQHGPQNVPMDIEISLNIQALSTGDVEDHVCVSLSVEALDIMRSQINEEVSIAEFWPEGVEYKILDMMRLNKRRKPSYPKLPRFFEIIVAKLYIKFGINFGRTYFCFGRLENLKFSFGRSKSLF